MDMTIVFQLFFVCGMFFISLGALYLPRKALAKNEPAELSPRALRILDLTNFFAVGVFLATCFVMLTPHVQSSFSTAFAQFKWDEEVSNKSVQLIIILGFLMIFFLEKILDYCKRDSQNYPDRNNGSYFLEESEDEFISKNRSTKKKYVVTFGESEEFEKTDDDDLEVNREETEQNVDFSHNNNNNNDINTTTQSPMIPNVHDISDLGSDVKMEEENDDDNDEDDEDESRRLVADSKSLDVSSSSNDQGRNKNFKVKIRSANNMYQKRKKNVNSNNIKGILSNKHCDKMVVGQPNSLSKVSKGHFDVRCAAMLIALCVHSVFEGATLGLQTDPWQFLGLAAAVALHQAVAAVAVGISLARRYLKFCPFLISALLFSAAIPVGVCAGILLSFLSGGGTQSSSNSGSSTAKVVSACLQGLTVGTFIYVIFIEILPSETNKRKDQLFKAFLLIIGFTLITIMAFFLAKT